MSLHAQEAMGFTGHFCLSLLGFGGSMRRSALLVMCPWDNILGRSNIREGALFCSPELTPWDSGHSTVCSLQR